MFTKSDKKSGHWNKGEKLVFDIDLTFLKNILMEVDKIVYFILFIQWIELFPGSSCIHICQITTKGLFSIFNTYVNDIFELLLLFGTYLWLISQLFDTICFHDLF